MKRVNRCVLVFHSEPFPHSLTLEVTAMVAAQVPAVVRSGASQVLARSGASPQQSKVKLARQRRRAEGFEALEGV